MKKKLKLFIIADHPFSPSGVGLQTKNMIDHLYSTGEYSFVCFGGAMKHHDYTPQKFESYGDDLIVYPVDGYGTADSVRSILRTEKPDILWFMTDPRFFSWLWEIEDEVRSLIPMVYYHVWDNYPYPHYNKIWYESTDVIVTISKVTDSIVKNVAPNVERHYLPHAVDYNHFKPLSLKERTSLRESLGVEKDKFVLFWNNRNARRKQPGTLIYWFKEFIDKVGHDKATLIMHTDPYDSNGPNLVSIIENLGINNGPVKFSKEKISAEQMAALYNIADATVNISDAEGFGLSTLESLSCATPILVNMTGGLQEQVTDGESWFGVGLEPSSKSVIGSQEIPYIYEDRLNKEDFINGLFKLYEMNKEQRLELGMKGRQHVMRNYNFDNYQKTWDKILKSVHERYGSWENRKFYKRWDLVEV